jgi:hypothetical protein
VPPNSDAYIELEAGLTDLLKFDGFGSHQISKLVILLFTDSKYLKKICKKTRMNSEQTGEDIFQKRHRLVC